jgi:cytochrome b involved in lipid metabolism
MTASLPYRLGTVLFWLALLALWIATPDPGDVAPAAPADIAISLDDVARHARADDCWMAIDGAVYDITPYVERHPAEPEVLLSWCGREATRAYRTKLSDRPHSARADGLLTQYRVGSLREAVTRNP